MEYAFAGPLAPLGYLSEDRAVRVEGLDNGVPRISDHMLNGVAFMYRTVEEAHSRARLGGTGFLIGREIPGAERVFGSPRYLPFLISNRHVVFEGSACVASVNRKDGRPPVVWNLDQERWICHPDGDDLVAASVWMQYNKAAQQVSFAREVDLLTQEKIAAFDVGVGEDVFMVGRFVNLQGTTKNMPAARFGNISAMPQDIATRGPGNIVRHQLSYAVEMRSRTGFSGSPVMAYRRRGTALTNVAVEHFWGVLGINWGYVKDEEGENTWLNGVIPAWKIVELLNTPALQAEVDEHAAQLARMGPVSQEEQDLVERILAGDLGGGDPT